MVNPTDPAYETEQGRVPLWLDASVVRRLAKACICGQPDGSGRHEQFCQHVRWRADAALHKAGMKSPVRSRDERRALLDAVRMFVHPTDRPVDEVAFAAAVDVVHDLLDPARAHEPGDLLRRDLEVAAARRLWDALDGVRWPLDPLERARDPEWGEVRRRAADLLAKAA